MIFEYLTDHQNLCTNPSDDWFHECNFDDLVTYHYENDQGEEDIFAEHNLEWFMQSLNI